MRRLDRDTPPAAKVCRSPRRSIIHGPCAAYRYGGPTCWKCDCPADGADNSPSPARRRRSRPKIRNQAMVHPRRQPRLNHILRLVNRQGRSRDVPRKARKAKTRRLAAAGFTRVSAPRVERIAGRECPRGDPIIRWYPRDRAGIERIIFDRTAPVWPECALSRQVNRHHPHAPCAAAVPAFPRPKDCGARAPSWCPHARYPWHRTHPPSRSTRYRCGR